MARAREASATSCFLLDARRRHAPPCLSSSLSRVLILSPEHSPPPLFSSPERSRRHRREPPWLPATPRLTDAPGSSAGPPSTSSTSHEAPDVPQHRPRCLLQPRDRRPSSSNSSAPVPPRARRGHRCTRCELLCCFPLFPGPISSSNTDAVAAESFSPPAMAQPWP